MSEPVTETPTPEFDYTTLIKENPTPTPPAPKAEVETPEVPAIDTETPEPETKAEAKPEPEPDKTKVDGTSDKWRQHIDQRLSHIEKLAKKVEDGTATPKETAQLEVKKDELEELLAEGSTAFPETQQVTKRLLDHEKKTKGEVEELREQLAAMREREAWRDEKVKYPSVNVEKVWDDTAKDASEAVLRKLKAGGIEFPDDVVKKLIHAERLEMYGKRAEEAQKSVVARKGTIPDKAATKPPAPKTPQGGRVTVSGSPHAVPHVKDDTKEFDFDYRTLYKPD